MPQVIPFSEKYDVLEEIAKSSFFRIHEAKRKSDGKRIVVKIIFKMGLNSDELVRLNIELNFWKKTSFDHLVELAAVYEQDNFIYIVYDYPLGGDLGSLIMNTNITFTEGFARIIAEKILNTLLYLHSNGISLGACLPMNIAFMLSTSVPGWVHSAKLTFFHNSSNMVSNLFSDLQDVAYTLTYIMRRQNQMIYRTTFHPRILYTLGWEHLSNEFIDFIKQLWNCEELNESIEYFTLHPWIHNRSRRSSSLTQRDSISPIHALISSSTSSTTPSIVSIKSALFYKSNIRDSYGRRRWKPYLGHLLHNVIIFSEAEDNRSSPSNHLVPPPVYLQDKALIISIISKHEYCFGLQDINSQIIVVWLRFNTSEDYQSWKTTITEITDPAKHKPPQNSIDKITNTSKSSTTGHTNTSFTEPPLYHQHQQEKEIKQIREICTDHISTINTNKRVYNLLLSSQSLSYLRSSTIRVGWIAPGNKIETESLAPFPSAHRRTVHPAYKWDHRAEELSLVLSTGVPLTAPMNDHEEWFIIDATWFRQWIQFVSSTRRKSVPGPIDNLWMINPDTDSPYMLLKEDIDDNHVGDFRRVTPQIWSMFEEWYGGGPIISVTGPPVEDTRRWKVLHSLPPQLEEFEGSECSEAEESASVTSSSTSSTSSGSSSSHSMASGTRGLPIETLLMEEKERLSRSLSTFGDENENIGDITQSFGFLSNSSSAIPKELQLEHRSSNDDDDDDSEKGSHDDNNTSISVSGRLVDKILQESKSLSQGQVPEYIMSMSMSTKSEVIATTTATSRVAAVKHSNSSTSIGITDSGPVTVWCRYKDELEAEEDEEEVDNDKRSKNTHSKHQNDHKPPHKEDQREGKNASSSSYTSHPPPPISTGISSPEAGVGVGVGVGIGDEGHAKQELIKNNFDESDDDDDSSNENDEDT